MSIHISSDGEEGLLTGDVAHHPCQMAHLDWSSTADSDPKQSAATRRELFSRFADTPTLVIGGHFNAGHIKREGDAFKFIAPGGEGARSSLAMLATSGRGQLNFRAALFHEASAVTEIAQLKSVEKSQENPEGVMKNEACSLRRQGFGKARPDR